MTTASKNISLDMSAASRIETLLANGFSYVKYEGQEGEFLAKKLPIEGLPYGKEHMIDGEYIVEGMMTVTELCPDNQVQLSIADADYTENFPFDSEEAIALLNDAMAGETTA